ncbi:heme-binding protein [Thiorhodococcus mannitoliphagus]|uniref:Heme-binding protein n=1 Tax=Thiorhodococcus mannitoliphagus TaxID=329406 RepID=A0A6P1E091_9GAMM|nr:heme-binding protein [Thiorhodococcus mannitoliphagus]NEX21414.1 heme-binding protein [Thiorhodococcus mannitoliphagus]
MKTLLIILASLALLGIAAMAVFVFVVQNVETPDYEVVRQEGPFEIRQYPPLVVAEVARKGSRKEALSAGFSPLAGYIFAKDRTGDRVAMTAPVTQQPGEKIPMTAPVTQAQTAEGSWRVRFIMPSSYALEALPPPADPDVRLQELPPQRVAAVRFSGRTTDAAIAEQEEALRAWLQAQGLSAADSPVYAYYNDPFTPGFLRRNEVLIRVAETQKG